MFMCVSQRLVAALVIILGLTACATSQLVPTDMESRIARSLSFQALKAEAEKFVGQWVVLGGQVLSAKRLKDSTQIEILQLLLDQGDRPIPTLNLSQGRFLALQEEFLDPATLPAGTLVSLVGEVVGARTQPLDESQYTYPVVKVITLKVWPPRRDYSRPYWEPYPYWYRPYPFWRGPFWGPYPYGWP
jgi:outer membrane lipoprotein